MQFLSKLFGKESSGSGENTISIVTNRRVYFPGDLVQGYVVLAVEEAVKIDSVTLSITGKESTALSRRIFFSTYKSMTRTWSAARLPIFQKRQIFKVKACLVQPEQVLDPGQYIVNFQYQLPLDIPASMRIHGLSKRGCGKIRYHIVATAAIPGLFKSNLSSRIYLMIEQPCPELIIPVQNEREIDVSGCCFSGGSLSAALLLDKSMFVDGETISAKIILDATSLQTPIAAITLSLVRVAQVYAHGVSARGRHDIAAMRSFGINPGEIEDRVLELIVPEDCVSSTSTDLVTISYQVVALMETNSVHKDVRVSVPIEIFSPRARDPAEVPLWQLPPEYNVLAVGPPPAYEEDMTSDEYYSISQGNDECQ